MINKLITFTLRSTYKALRNAKINRPNAISSIFCAKLANTLALPVSTLFSASYNHAQLPTDWRML